ncbi:phosphotransferase [Spirillospora sp. CA-255316]
MRTFDARYGFVVEVETDHGYLVVRSSPDPLGMMQAEVSRSLSNLGIGPPIYEVIQTSVSVWTVAGRIFPGDSLHGGAVSLETLAPIFQKMRDQESPSDRLPTLADWLHSRLSDENLSDLAPGSAQAPPVERRHAAAILEDLESGASNLLCHGDTSSKNILHGPGGQLFLIDPRGVSGDVCYDVAVAAWKTAGEEQASARAEELARLVGVDRERVQAWLLVADTARV